MDKYEEALELANRQVERYEDLMKEYPQPAETARYLEVIFPDALKLAQALLSLHAELVRYEKNYESAVTGRKDFREAFKNSQSQLTLTQERLDKAEEVLKDIDKCGENTCGACAGKIDAYFKEYSK